MARSRLLLAFASLVLLGACPVGCPQGKPKTIYDGPLERVEIRQTGRCSFQIIGSMEGRPYKSSRAGYYSLVIDTYPVWPDDVIFDPESRTLTVHDKWLCHEGLVAELYFQTFVYTVSPP